MEPVAESCPRLGGSWVEIGRDLTRDFQERTRESPRYAVLTSALHVNVPFNPAQRFVNRLDELSNEELLDEDSVRSVLAPPVGRKYRFPNQAAKKVVTGMRTFNRVCGEDGRACLREPTRSELRQELSRTWGFSKKTSDLAMEYLGDEDAVCVDRHLKRLACNMGAHRRKGISCVKGKYEMSPMGREYEDVADFIRKKSRRCGLKPIELQVGLWLKGVCSDVRRGGMRVREIVLDENHRYPCGLAELGESARTMGMWMR